MTQRLARGVQRIGLLLAIVLIVGCTSEVPCPSWNAWSEFRETFMTADGRVVDRGSADARTVSEGQAYALLFALAANDRAAFDTLLNWTENNLAAGDLTARLPAWLWGQDSDGDWGILDGNAASDADTWMAYALIEAGRLWKEPRYSALGKLLAERVWREEVVSLPGLGPTLLPAPTGFEHGSGQWRLNPSYLPLPLLRRLAAVDRQWRPVVASARAVVMGSAVAGFAPDWTLFSAGDGFLTDPQYQTQGDYDAIRVYLWAGMTHPDDPARNDVLSKLDGMERAIRSDGVPPAQTQGGQASDEAGPPGFSAALVPYLMARGEVRLAEQQLQRLQARPIPAAAYYQQALRLFGVGWYEKWLRFGPSGRLNVRWNNSACG